MIKMELDCIETKNNKSTRHKPNVDMMSQVIDAEPKEQETNRLENNNQCEC